MHALCLYLSLLLSIWSVRGHVPDPIPRSPACHATGLLTAGRRVGVARVDSLIPGMHGATISAYY